MATSTQNICRACGRSILQVPAESEKLRSSTNDSKITVVCEACKKFYSRYRGKLDQIKCLCSGASNFEDNCRLCRYKQCEEALIGTFQSEATPALDSLPQEKVDFSKIPCAVCGVSSSGFHFGVVSCEGCKGFFRRSMNKDYKIQYTCKSVKKSLELLAGELLCPTSSNCRKCRLKRCTDAGMSMTKIGNGRHTFRRQVEVDAVIRKHSSQGSFLKEKMTRRKNNVSSNLETEDQSSESARKMTHSNESEKNSKVEKCDVGVVTPNDMSTSSEAMISVFDLGQAYSEHVDCHLDNCLKESCKFYTERAVTAAAKLSNISKSRIVLDHGATEEQFVAAMVASLEIYMKCVSEFVIALPGTNRIKLSDRILLFTQGFFPLSTAQLSLDFDVEKQLPNHLSLDRVGPAFEIAAKTRSTINFPVENYLIEAGNRFVQAINNLEEFSLFCALLFLNPETPNLEDVELVRWLRRRYDIALFRHFTTDVGSEERLAQIYLLLPFFRRATALLEHLFTEVNSKTWTDKRFFSPLFSHLETQVLSQPQQSPSINESLQ